MSEAEASGRTVEEAVERALALLGARREDVEVEVEDPGSRGVWGLAARPVRVRVRRLRKGEVARRFLLEFGRRVQSGFEVTVRSPTGEDRAWYLDVETPDAARWIGRGGETLAALERLCEAAAARASGDRTRLQLDLAGYRRRREESLGARARRAAAAVRRSGREVALEPMPPADRRAVHLALRGVPGVRTESRGEGGARQVVIVPDRPPSEGAP